MADTDEQKPVEPDPQPQVSPFADPLIEKIEKSIDGDEIERRRNDD